MKQVQGAMRDLQGQTGGVEKALSGLGGYFTGGAVLQFAQQLGQAALRMAEFAQQTHMVRTSMQGLASSFGESADGMISAMQRASGGTISEYNLMLAANKAMMLGVASNAGELEGILRVAMTRGAAMGLSTTQAFDDLVTGLGRGSALILDNLGITMASLRSAESDYAAALGKTTDALTDQERKQAMVNAVLKEAAGIDASGVDAMAGGFARLRAAADDLAAAIGERLRPALDGAAGSAADLINNISGNVPELTLTQQLREAQKSVTDLREQWAATKKQLTADELQTIYDLQDAMLRGASSDPVVFDQAMTAATNAGLLESLALLDQLDTAVTQMLALQRKANEESFTSGENVRLQQMVNNIQSERDQAAAIVAVREQMYAQINQMAESAINRLVEATGNPTVFGNLESFSSRMRSLFENYQTMGLTAEQALIMVSGAIDRNIASMESAISTTGTFASVTDTAKVAVNDLESALGAAGGAMGGAMGFIGGMIGRLDEMSKAARQAKQDLFDMSANTIKGANLAAASTLGAAEAQALYTQQIDTLNTARAEMMASGMSVADVEFQLAELEGTLTEQTRERVRAVDDATRAMNDGATASSSYASSLSDVNSALASRVNSAVNAQLDPGVGVNPQDYMPRQDAPNENARRLADIMVNGFKGQDWMGQFQNEVPDIYQMLVDAQDPQAAAAQLLQQFQQGMLPQLIDKEALKQQIKDQLAGDANMAAYAQQIMQELIAEGAGDPQAIQQAVNRTMGTSMGKTTGPTDVTSGVVSQLKAETFLKQLNGAGGDAAAQWGSAFLASVGENVPMALIMILATLVAPIIAQGQADAAGQTGAQ